MPQPRATRAQKPTQTAPARLNALLGTKAPLAAILLVLLASLRMASTWTVFNQTSDEPAHLACGMEWLSKGVYKYEHQHPPLTRVMIALGPFLLGERSWDKDEMSVEGVTILHSSHRYFTILAASRAGNLPLFWLACWMVYLWGRRTYGPAGATLAVLVFSMLPLVLAHGSLSTTDMGLTAFLAAALYTLLRCVERPGWRSGLFFGFALGGMVLTKFSCLVYFPASVALMAALWLWRVRPSVASLAAGTKRAAPPVALGLLAAFFVVWAGYRFSFGASPWFPFPVPFPEVFSGIDQVRLHNEEGHLSYLLGSQSSRGFWLFFPLVILVKTPLAVLLMWTANVIWRGQPERPGWVAGLSVAIAAAMLAVATAANINIGLRHLMPAFVFGAVWAAGGLLALLHAAPQRRWAYPAMLTVTGWLAVSGAAVHPDYLAYFNALAGDRPEKIVVDSDLDWGQDLLRLSARLRELNAPSVAFSRTVYANLPLLGFPPTEPNDPFIPAQGWNAVSLTHWKLYRMGLVEQQPGVWTWPDKAVPAEKVGRTIILYYFRPQPGTQRR